ERTEVDDAVGVVALERRERVGRESEQAIRIVLENEYAVAVADLRDRLATLCSQRDASGIVEVGHRVQHLGAPPGGSELPQRGLQSLDNEPAIIHRHVDDVRLV